LTAVNYVHCIPAGETVQYKGNLVVTNVWSM